MKSRLSCCNVSVLVNSTLQQLMQQQECLLWQATACKKIAGCDCVSSCESTQCPNMHTSMQHLKQPCLMSRTMKQMTATMKPTFPMEAASTSRCSCSGVLAGSVMTRDIVFPYSVLTPTATTRMEPEPSFSCSRRCHYQQHEQALTGMSASSSHEGWSCSERIKT